MSSTTSLERSSFVADFELIFDGRSIRPAQVAQNFIILDKPEVVPPGPAELIIRVEGKDEDRQHIEIVGPVDGNPARLAIRRTRS